MKQIIFFRPKRIGWGWEPANLGGWLTVVLFGVFLVSNFFRIDSSSHSVSDTLIIFIPQSILAVLGLIGFAAITSDGQPWKNSS